jgi:hypothetical protein
MLGDAAKFAAPLVQRTPPGAKYQVAAVGIEP